MSVFILGGKAKSLEIYLPKNVSFRPTSVMLRRKLFDLKQNWDGFKFIDLCAGSGCMGFEALSRNASDVYFLDRSEVALKLIHKNKESWLGKFPEDRSKIHIKKMHAIDYLKTMEVDFMSWVFFDPPYQEIKLYEEFVECLKQADYSAIGGIVVEYEIIRKKVPSWLDKLASIEGLRIRKELESSDRKLLLLQGDKNV